MTFKTRPGISRLFLPSGESDLVRAMVLLPCLNYRWARKEREDGKGDVGATAGTRSSDSARTGSGMEDSGRVRDRRRRPSRQVSAARGGSSEGDHLGRAGAGADRREGPGARNLQGDGGLRLHPQADDQGRKVRLRLGEQRHHFRAFPDLGRGQGGARARPCPPGQGGLDRRGPRGTQPPRPPSREDRGTSGSGRRASQVPEGVPDRGPWLVLGERGWFSCFHLYRRGRSVPRLAVGRLQLARDLPIPRRSQGRRVVRTSS